ncbi:hypothetical protein BN1222_03582 [Klebsiella quasipneumoniae]|uniref:hypothetical protein n=1 Tax=Klebsiella quasipneumoniae TaxID=1463165 RepID=UPI0005E32E34|nr:hypothetical protein [Klebsiella quasipneumoniae]CEL82320.1 hypothetical protein BN1222_03582 [Klebsiella quasipneumoniae]
MSNEYNDALNYLNEMVLEATKLAAKFPEENKLSDENKMPEPWFKKLAIMACYSGYPMRKIFMMLKDSDYSYMDFCSEIEKLEKK